MTKRDPFRPVDAEARALARQLIDAARFAAIAVLERGAPAVTRIAFATCPDGAPLSLISELSSHTQALEADPTCSLLVGEPGEKGDPLTHPRLTLMARARFVPRASTEHETLRSVYLSQNPKAQLYIDFADFHLVRFDVTAALLNGGFGKAYKLTPEDLRRR
ncbi:MAG: pyridoxamine 5'-phosphate oxidase family protein [Pseudomonadota bacterium]